MRKMRFKRECIRHLTNTFGLECYRPGQKRAVHTLLSGRDVLCVLPTGAGKSLCWQLPALVHPGLTVVVSPLIALMRDQVQHLSALGIPAASLDSLMSSQERQRMTKRIRSGEIRIVFVSPERLEQQAFRQLCRDVPPWLIVVDEAHCVVRWGDSFRPAYHGIASFISMLKKRPAVCAMTATADESMQRAIVSALQMKRPRRILLPILRENLVYTVLTTLDRTGQILQLQQQTACRTVIFCRSRVRCEHLAERLSTQGVSAAYYHAGMERAERMSVQHRFQSGTFEVLCATTAFGMGVDIPDIRRVIHDYLPDTLIDYVQQTGRCGRDGQRAECILLFEPNEIVRKASITRHAKAKYPWQPIRRQIYLRRFWQEQRKLLRVLFASACIPGGIARAFGSQSQACGVCSACRQGVRLQRVPSFAGMKKWQLRAWLLRWQRDMAARQKGVPAKKFVTDRQINTAARSLVFPAGSQTPDELERLIAYFRRNE